MTRRMRALSSATKLESCFSALWKLKVPSKSEQLVRHSALESAAGTPPGLTWSPWAVRQQCSSHSQTCSQRASRSKCPLRKLFPIVLRGARCRSHRRTRALLRSVTSLHCRVDVCRETPRIMPGVWRASRDGLCPSRILQYYPWHGFGSLDSGPGGHCGPRYVYTLQTHLPTLVERTSSRLVDGLYHVPSTDVRR